MVVEAPAPKVMQTVELADSDGDGVADNVDQCPNTPTSRVDARGCPLDSDRDGVADYRDQCPGTPRGADVNDTGCWVLEMVHFDFDKFDIKPRYYGVLQQTAKVLKENPSLKIEIQGHTDSIGSPDYNQPLSQKRAKVIQDYLVQQGIPQERLSAKGYGQSQPIAGNDNRDGRAQNRRTQLNPLP